MTQDKQAIELRRLTDRALSGLKVLYLAPFAPETGAPKPPLDPSVGIARRYNHELFVILQALGLQVTPCRGLNEFLTFVEHYEYVFSIYNRAPMRNSEVFVSSTCEFFGIPYLGSYPNMRALAEDKYLSKQFAQTLGIPTTPGRCFSSPEQSLSPPDFPGPYFVKPRFGAASEGISVDSFQESWEGAADELRNLLQQNIPCLVEQGIDGVDVTVPVLGGQPPIVLPCLEEHSELPFGIATYRQKRLIDGGRERRVLWNAQLADRLQGYARRLCEHLDPFDYLRLDFRLDGNGRAYLLEFNFGCNLGSHAAVAQSARQVGISQVALIDHIIGYSLERQGKLFASRDEPRPLTEQVTGYK